LISEAKKTGRHVVLSLGCNTLCYKFDQYRVNAPAQYYRLPKSSKLVQALKMWSQT